MQIRLQMLMKAPVVFTQYNPPKVIDSKCVADALGRSNSKEDAISRLWAAYGRALLSDVDPCMEANEGVRAMLERLSELRRLSENPSLSGMSVCWVAPGCYSIAVNGACLYLYENPCREVFVSFPLHGAETETIDLSDYGSDAAVSFLSTIIGAYTDIEQLI